MTQAMPVRERYYRLLENAAGHRCLWPASRKVPLGWRETAGPAPRAECLARLTAASKTAQRETCVPAIAFSLMFFGGDEGSGARDKYEFLIQAARYADENGFAAVWLPERHFTQMGSLYPNPAVLHAALARETKRLRLRAGSVVLPINDPIRVAEEWAIVDNLSGGRVELSFAPGWNIEDFVLGPGLYERRYEVMYERIATVDKLWSGASIEASAGPGRRCRVRTYPTPLQPRLTKWVTAAGSPTSFQQAGRIGVNVLTHLFDQDIDELAAKIKLYRDARREHGWDPDVGQVAVALHTYLASSAEAVVARARGPYLQYLRTNLKLIERLAQSRGMPLDVSTLNPTQIDEVLEWIFEKFLRHRSLLGTPESCAPLVQRLVEIGVQEVTCLLDFGPSTEAILESLPHLCALKDRCHSFIRAGNG
jgi:phthiocerol/phenolphthiocerol synthesis type-I polyketide synthase D